MATTEVLKYNYKAPTKLKYLSPAATDIVLTFTVKEKDVNPLFLKELKTRVHKEYLEVLNDAWNDMWESQDKKLEKVIPDFATKTKGAREKLLAVFIGPVETEYKKQIKNISSHAQTIGERYWAEIAKERGEIRNFKIKVGAKVVWKGLKVTSSVVTIVGTGGAAALAYAGAVKNLYGIYKDMKTVFDSADDYTTKVYMDIEAIRMALWKRNGIDKENAKALIKADEKIASKPLKSLASNRKILKVKVNQLHRKAGKASTEVAKAEKSMKEALGVDQKLYKEHSAKVQTLSKNLDDQLKQYKWFLDFDKMAGDYQVRIELRMKEETIYLKAYKGGKYTLKEVTVYFLSTTSDIAVAKAVSSGGAKLSNIMSGWGDKLNTGLDILSAIGIG